VGLRFSGQFPQESEMLGPLPSFDLFSAMHQSGRTLEISRVNGGVYFGLGLPLLERQTVQVKPPGAAFQTGPFG
jgi:hypothetical protein